MAEERKEFWRWPEYRYTVPDKDWRDGKIITAGVDVGSVSSKTVIMVDGELYAYAIMRTGSSKFGQCRKGDGMGAGRHRTDSRRYPLHRRDRLRSGQRPLC